MSTRTAVIMGVVVLAWMVGAGVRGAFSVESNTPSVARAAVTAGPVGPLVLESSKALRQYDYFRVTGVVSNAGTQAISGLRVVVQGLGADGRQVNYQAPTIEMDPLTPGQESPWRVMLTDPAGEIRDYRVSFKNTAGAAIPHTVRK